MTSRFAPRRWFIMAASWLWFWLRRPWLAIVAGIIGATLALAVWQLPQLPGQLVEEHAAAANWLLNTSTTYGIWGNFFLALGLFDVLRSPLLYLLLALLLPTLAAQLADQLGALRQFRDVHRLDLSQLVDIEGEALPLAHTRPLYRDRSLVQHDAAHVASHVATLIEASFPQVAQARVAAAELATDGGIEAGSIEAGNVTTVDEAATIAVPELRIRGLRHPRVQYLRPLLMIGLLIAVTGAWVALAFGWQITAPPLAPGATYRSANRDLILHYSVPTSATHAVTLTANFQNARIALPASDAARGPLGTATLQVRPAYPAILITTTDGDARLTLPGDATLRAQIGLVFAEPGSEESILIPDQSTGLRVVQRAGSDSFVLELYRSDTVQPIYRADLTPGGQLNVPFGSTDPGLIITAMPGLQVDVRHLPGLLLVPLGIFVALVGALAFQRDSAFIVAQVAPWTTGYSVVVLQADRAGTIEGLRRGLDTMPTATAVTVVDETMPSPSSPEAHA